jgi:two-component system, OmpR family, sensor histidine kinase KdpD
LHTYLGTAPGVGKTYAMLAEGRRRAEGGERVVVGWLERHGRAETRAQVGDLDVAPARTVSYRGVDFDDLDVEAMIALGPDVALVDELAHTVADGSRQRWEDIAAMLAAGIDVLTTVNVANLISTRDYAARIAGAGTVESVPDEFVRSGEVVLVDVPADLLRQRIASGRIYSTEWVGGALAGYFRTCNLEALSELGRAWIDGTVDLVGSDLLVRHGLEDATPRPLVVAGVSDSEWGQRVIAHAAEVAISEDADLLVAHVNPADGLRQHEAVLDRYRALTTEMGGTYTEVRGSVPADSLADIARARQATRVVVARHRSRLGELTHGSVAARLRRLLPDVTIDEVHGEA